MTTLITNAKLIKLAKQAGFNLEFDAYVYEHWDNFQAFAKLVAEKSASVEREACAKVCDSDATIEGIAQRCAEAIRARGEPTIRG